MITVNLLPAEYRKRDRTPLRVFGALLLGIVIVGAVGFYYTKVRFGELGAVETAVQEKTAEMNQLKPQVKHYESLVAERADYMAREDTIVQISSSRIAWTKKIDEFIDIVNAGEPREEGSDGYLAWFGSLQIRQDPLAKRGKGKEGNSAGSMSLKGSCATEHISDVMNFIDDITGNEEFFKDFNDIDDPRLQSNESQEKGLEPSSVMTFPVKMGIRIPRDTKKKSGKGKES